MKKQSVTADGRQTNRQGKLGVNIKNTKLKLSALTAVCYRERPVLVVEGLQVLEVGQVVTGGQEWVGHVYTEALIIKHVQRAWHATF